ncbi:hypothetical protein EVAR_71456_1 [Eumeta japonica]|uniref:Uncharacterized protein n=1 Tax=Eumeta variegata TaxID=151549 RepID=A0A4C2ABK1_EUMVA|nr:hypothetical protein EVAR_71456_1 [Eumeta japonica]
MGEERKHHHRLGKTLPEWMEKKNENSYLQLKQLELEALAMAVSSLRTVASQNSHRDPLTFAGNSSYKP